MKTSMIGILAVLLFFAIEGCKKNSVDDNNVSVVPNPASDAWTFYFNNKDRQPQSITVVDAVGRRVYSQNIVDITRQNISCKNLAVGIYSATVQFNNGDKISVRLSKN